MSTFNVTPDALQELYQNFEPASRNLFEVRVFGAYSVAAESLDKVSKFHATKVTFNGESLNLLRNKATKNFQVTSDTPYARTELLTITWREDKNWTIKKYHEDWLSNFYNRSSDQFESHTTTNALYKTFKIYLPSKKTIVFSDVIPKNIGDLNFEWSNNPSGVQYTLSYYVSDWWWEDRASE